MSDGWRQLTSNDRSADDVRLSKDSPHSTSIKQQKRIYACFLLVQTLYFPRSHNIKFLRSLAEDSEPRLIAAWPRAARLDRRRFELLKRAYVEARYSASYEIGTEDLQAPVAVGSCAPRHR